MNTVPDRIEKLLAQSAVTGIDFIYVDKFQVQLDVYFLNQPGTLTDPMTDAAANLNPFLDPSKIRIHNPSGDVPDVGVRLLKWETLLNGREILRLTASGPGDFTLYKLYIDDSRVDSFYNDITFNFKVGCPSRFDCKTKEHECPPEELVDFPVDYMARDFWSFRNALFEFASLRHPGWRDRLEADAGNMMAELMSALGDEMAYYQDRVSRESYLETATQRRSLRHHARLIDYHIHDGLAATTWLEITLDIPLIAGIPAGTKIQALSDTGLKILFEAGKGLKEKLANKNYAVKKICNEFPVHIWDEDETCLLVGTTEIYIEGHHDTDLVFDEFPDDRPLGVKWVLLQTTPADPSLPVRAHLVRLIEIKNDVDFVLGANITHLVWENDHATPFELDMTVLTVRGNIIPATAGNTQEIYLIARSDSSTLTPVQLNVLNEANQFKDAAYMLEREGPGNSVICLFTIPGSATQSVAMLGPDPQQGEPEIFLEEMKFRPAAGLLPDAWISNGIIWSYRKALVGIHSSGPAERHFTLDDGSWQRVVGYHRNGQEIIHEDYAANEGMTLRFGDGEFGKIPGENTVFHMFYRLSNGKDDNVTAHTLKQAEKIPLLTLKVTNPLPVFSGRDLETHDEVRQLAPDAFRAIAYRAVRPEDYAEAAERLPWVQRAGASFRWTGSWLSAFVTPDPLGAAILVAERRKELVEHLDRFRQAGREVIVSDPQYANLDIEIEVCAADDAFPGELEERIMEALAGKKGILARPGYFSNDRFSFGTQLLRSTLEAWIQAVPGVKAVESIYLERRGWFRRELFTKMEYYPGAETIIRVENDPLHPERGSLKINIHGGS